MATIDDLTRLIPPPAAPVHADGDWAAVEATLGLSLPADYRALVAAYGLGGFDDINLLTPFAAAVSEHADLLWHAGRLHQLLGESRAKNPDAVPFPLFPEPGGLLEWAGTGTGIALCWLTGGEPDSWPVVVFDYLYHKERYEVGAVDLLHGHFSGSRVIDGLDEPPRTPWFDAHRDREHVYVRLSDSAVPYAERLRILRAALAPTADRGSFVDEDEGDDSRQDHFKAIDRDWQVTYETAYGHQIRVAFPPADAAAARSVIFAAARDMGCTVTRTTTHRGEPVWT
ncbi:hypothetical protein GCM10009682_21200 [Luedemannella flava]|uniref:Knr4/Smi1-like domain-containing protein n=1 Tax=Luedemannella flava TaxID=349316 RepID=A0ABP4XZP1_9ACTN